MLIVALSGAVASGKSTVAEAVLRHVEGIRISTRQLILDLTETDSERLSLQEAGDRLDIETGGAWVTEGVESRIGDDRLQIVVVDAVRRIEQVERLRSAFPEGVRHVHLTASPVELAKRHSARRHDVVEPADYSEVLTNSTEAEVDRLAGSADVVMDISSMDQRGIAETALSGLGLLTPPKRTALVDVVVGGQYGSEGKGNVCSFLARDYDVLMRVGGPNAGHRVKDPDFDFVHLPSGTLHNPEAKLLIGAGATLSLEVLADEIGTLKIEPERLSIDPQAIVIEDADREWEAEVLEVIGSTKKGVGVATARKILNRGKEDGFGSPVRLARDVPELEPFVRPVHIELEKAFHAGSKIMLEGTQGTDLSIHHGQWPHVTSRETTASGCLADAGIAPLRVRDVIMVVRTYPIRVGGTSGPMGVEIDFPEIARRSGSDEEDLRTTEVGTVSKKPRRVAEFDLGQVRRAATLNGATRIALTFADYISVENRDASSFETLTDRTRQFIERIEEATGVSVDLVATGPHRSQMIDRRIP